MDKKKLKQQLRILEEMINSNTCDDNIWEGVFTTFRTYASSKTLSMKEVANYFGVSPRTIRRWIKEQDFPSGTRHGHHELSFPYDKIVEWKVTHEETI